MIKLIYLKNLSMTKIKSYALYLVVLGLNYDFEYYYFLTQKICNYLYKKYHSYFASRIVITLSSLISRLSRSALRLNVFRVSSMRGHMLPRVLQPTSFRELILSLVDITYTNVFNQLFTVKLIHRFILTCNCKYKNTC